MPLFTWVPSDASKLTAGTVAGARLPTPLQTAAASVAPVAAIAAPTAPGVIYAQAEMASLKTAVDAIRAALVTYGVTL